MKRLLQVIFLATIVDFYFFPVRFTFIPSAVNSKMMVAAFGYAAFVYKCLQEKTVHLSKRTVIAAILSVLFSLSCYFSVITNGTDDMTYVSYWTSFATWMGGAYGDYVMIKAIEKKADLASISKYLLIVCVAQCIIALLIDNFPAIDRLVSMLIAQANDFYKKHNRLYGIGCALDTAGVRFSAVLLLIGYQMVHNENITGQVKNLTKYLVGFIILSVVGSMISRTTTVGAVLAIAYIIFTNAAVKRGGYVKKSQLWFFALFIGLILGFFALGSSLYNSSPEARRLFRFGFEGFFNWAETGEFRTNSTDILLKVMWIWPKTFHDWMIGAGKFGVFAWGTDIGYCNFVLYCGLIGFSVFASYFIYVSLSLNTKFKDFYLLSLLLITLQAIIWAKVTTDIFLLEALLLCVDGDVMTQPHSE
ncbi:MAG: hypothetical protein IKW99_01340 [Bacteroidales bacterium]|nr:hypothetical protein [Bacteroidales bacterium]